MSSSVARTEPTIVLPALVTGVLPIAILWGLMVALASLAHQPGVICVTPLAWLAATWTGTRYTLACERAGIRPTLLGPTVAGLILGAFMAIVWLLGSRALQDPAASASDIEKERHLDIGISVASLLCCTLFALVGGALARSRGARLPG